MTFSASDPFRFQAGGASFVLTGRLYAAAGERLRFHDGLGAEIFFHQLLPDPTTVDRLRKWIGTDPGRTQDLTDHALIDEVASQVASGELALWQLGRTVSAKGEKVVKRFHERIEREMTMTARDLVNPSVQPIEGFPGLKEIPPEKIKDALVEMFLDLPLGDSELGRAFADVLADTPVGRGRDLSTLSPKELGDKVASDAKEWAKDRVDGLRKDHPAVFWSMAAAAFVGAGALLYTQGTGVAAKIGIKPELEQSLFDGKLKLRERVEFGPELRNPKLQLDATGKVADGKVELRAGTTLAGEDLKHIRPTEYRAGATLRHGATTLDGSATLDGDGDLQRYAVTGSHSWKEVGALDQLSASGGYQRDFVTGAESLTGGIAGKSGTLDFSLRGSHDFTSETTRVMGDIGKQIGENGRLSGFVEQSWSPSGSSTAAGVMFTLRF